MRIPLAALVVSGAIAFLVGGSAGAGSINEIDYATYDARVIDSKGVTTDVKELGYLTSVNILTAFRGDADVEVPFRLIKTIELGEFVAVNRRAPCTVTLRSGKSIALEVDAVEEDRLLRGRAEFGEFRIRMGRIRRLDLLGLSHTGAD